MRRGIACGELPATADPELLVEALTAPLYFRVFISGEPLDGAFLDNLLDLLVSRRDAEDAEGRREPDASALTSTR